MDYLLTWVEGEEVAYRFLERDELGKIELEPDREYSLTELSPSQEIPKKLEEFVK